MTQQAVHAKPALVSQRNSHLMDYLEQHVHLRCKGVELKMYRSCHTAATCEQTLPHFEYLIYVHWPGAASAPAKQSHSHWQAPLIVRRRWADVNAFHRVLQAEIVYDPEHGIHRTEMKLPELPKEDDVDDWVSATGAAGDVRTLSRNDDVRYLPHSEAFHAKEALHERHDNLTRRLDHFLKRVCMVLNTLPSDLIVRCPGVRKFLTPSAMDTSSAILGQFLGPQPMFMPSEEGRPQSAKFKESNANAVPQSSGNAERRSSLKRPSTAGATLESEGRPTAGAQNVRRPSTASISGSGAVSASKKSRPSSSPAHLTREPSRGANENEDPAIFNKSKSHHLMLWRGMPPDEAGCSGAAIWQHRQEAKHLRHKALMSHSRSVGMVSERKRPTLQDLKRPSVIDKLKDKFGTPVSPLSTKSSFSMASPGSLDTSASGTPQKGNKFKKALMRSSAFGNADKSRQERQLRLMHQTMTSSYWERTHREICEGFRAVLFGPQKLSRKTSPGPGSPKNRRAAIGGSGAEGAMAMKLGNPDQVHELFKMYRGMVQFDHGRKMKISKVNENDPESVIDALLREKDVPDETEQKMLDPVCWERLLQWVDKERSYAMSRVDQKHCDKLAQGLCKLHDEMSWQVPRVSLPMIMQLIWPHADLESIGQMLSWIVNAELEKHRELTPPPLDEHGRRQLLDLFHLLDVDGSGSISAEELAETVEGRHIGPRMLEPEVVRAVVGEGDLTIEQFMEYMCEDGYRPSHTSTHAFRDGQELRLERWKDVEWAGWVRSKGRSAEMEKHYQWLKELKAEVNWWRSKAQADRAKQNREQMREWASLGRSGERSPSPSSRATFGRSNSQTMRSRLKSALAMVRVGTNVAQDQDPEEPMSPAMRISKMRDLAEAEVTGRP